LARLLKFSGTGNLPDVRRPPVVADTAVGAATETLGRQIRQSAGQVGRLGQLLRRRQEQIDRLEVNRAVRQLDAGLKQKETAERQALPPGAVGFTETMLAHFKKDGEQVIATQPKRLQARLAKDIETQRDLYANRFAALEYAEALKYFRDGITETVQAKAAEIEQSPGALETALGSISELVEHSPLPEDERRRLLNTSADMLIETWAETLPPEQVLALLDEGNGGEGTDSLASQATASPAGQETPSKMQGLSSQARARLSGSARDEMAVAEIRESEEIAERIVAEGRGFDPQVIHASRNLAPSRKKHFLDLLDKQVRKEEDGLAALEWAHNSAPGDPFSKADRMVADSAFRRLTAKGGDPDQIARSLLRNKGLLPDAYAAGLLNQLRSREPDNVRSGFEKLSVASEIDPVSLRSGRSGARLWDELAKWRVLTQSQALGPDEASVKLARMNDPAVRTAVTDQLVSGNQAGRLPVIDPDDLLGLMAARLLSDQAG
jgi:lambda repressor-like predicted transcriptional regulator